MFRKRRLTNAGGPSSQLKKQRVVDVVKIILDVAEDSAGWFPPLKSALGGVTALIKHYEEFESVKDKIEGLKPQLDRLKQNITTAIDRDPDESNRRAKLIHSLREIENKSQELLEKGRVARFVDKTRDSAEVARLVERFQEAITHYQMSQQQAIYDRIIDLASSFDTLLKLQEKSPAVKSKLNSVMERLERLCSVEDSDDDSERGRWEKLFSALQLIKDNGNILHNHINAQGYEESESDIEAVSRIAEDIRDALLEYQMSQQCAIYNQNCKMIDAMDLAVLNNCRRARGAAYQHGNRRGCLRGTREAVLNEIELWTQDFNKSPVFWLNGLAGTGKSTIAQTIAERMFADGLLGASFFCSRDFEDRSDLHFIFPTLAFQLAHRFPSFRAHLVTLLQSDPDVVDEPLYNQMTRLIVEPLRSADISTVIVVDALDECKDDEPSSAILSVLGRLVEDIPTVKFFITGRPEPRIKTGFRLPLLEDATKVFVLHDVHPDEINNDIKLFLKHELSVLSLRRRLDGWPREEHLDLLCRRAAGLFIYAVATVKFLDSKNHLPKRRLDVIVNVPECTIPEGKTQFKPSTTLDSLYMSVLQMAFDKEDPNVDSKVRSIIGAVVMLVNPLPPSAIAKFTNLDHEEVILHLTSVESLLVLDEDSTQPVKPFHKSFPDFVTDPSRCIDTRFYISRGSQHLLLAINCLRVLNEELEQNLLNLPDYALNSEIEDLQIRVDGRIDAALRYTCQSWHNHLIMSEGDAADAILHLRFFLEEKFLAWLEVLSVVKATRVAVVALERLMRWLPEVSKDQVLIEMAKDCFYFVTEFFEPINASATHIYHSALELCPRLSVVRKLYYHRRLIPFPRVEIGIPDSRDPNIAIPRKDVHGNFRFSSWSPCGQFVAARVTNVVEIRDALTFELVSTLQPITLFRSSPSYSPDGHSLACATATGIIIWDIQTGGVAKSIQCQLEWPSRLVWSSDGGVVGVRSNETIHMNDVASCTAVSSVSLGSSHVREFWAHNESFRIWMDELRNGINYNPTLINIFEIGPSMTKVESFRIRLEEGNCDISSFSPTTYRISGLLKNPIQLIILDIRTLTRLLVEKGHFYLNSHSFSSDGNRFAACRAASVHVWNYAGNRYIPWRQFLYPIESVGYYVIQFSPTSSSILVHSLDTLRLWRLDGPPITAAHIPQLNIFSPTGTHTGAVQYRGSTITITNHLSQTTSQSINTGFKIAGIGLTGNVLLAKGPSVVVAWLLTEEGSIDNISGTRKAGRSDSIWTMSVSHSRSVLNFSIEGDIGVIKDGDALHIYNIRTGDLLAVPGLGLSHFSGPWHSFKDHIQARDHHCKSSLQNPPDDWEPNLAEVWLKDHQGKHLLWLPTGWREKSWAAQWFSHISTITFKSQEKKPVVIRLN